MLFSSVSLLRIFFSTPSGLNFMKIRGFGVCYGDFSADLINSSLIMFRKSSRIIIVEMCCESASLLRYMQYLNYLAYHLSSGGLRMGVY